MGLLMDDESLPSQASLAQPKSRGPVQAKGWGTGLSGGGGSGGVARAARFQGGPGGDPWPAAVPEATGVAQGPGTVHVPLTGVNSGHLRVVMADIDMDAADTRPGPGPDHDIVDDEAADY